MDTLIEAGESYEIYSSPDWGPAIPYPSIDRMDGNINHGFVDFRSNPEEVTTIPEAQGKPGLIELLVSINANESALMSLGCANGMLSADPPQEHYESPKCFIWSYIDLAYRDARLGEKENLVALAKTIAQERKLQEREWTIMNLVIQPMKHFFGITGRFNLTLKLDAYGRSEAEAWIVFNAQCREMAKVFRRLSL